jgi:hypothetical protein
MSSSIVDEDVRFLLSQPNMSVFPVVVDRTELLNASKYLAATSCAQSTGARHTLTLHVGNQLTCQAIPALAGFQIASSFAG